MQESCQVVIPDLADRFGIRDMMNASSGDDAFMVSLLYYFGVLLPQETITEQGKLVLRVPNLVMRKLYVERLAELLLPSPQDRDEGRLAAEKVYQGGNIGPLCTFVSIIKFFNQIKRRVQPSQQIKLCVSFLRDTSQQYKLSDRQYEL